MHIYFALSTTITMADLHGSTDIQWKYELVKVIDFSSW